MDKITAEKYASPGGGSYENEMRDATNHAYVCIYLYTTPKTAGVIISLICDSGRCYGGRKRGDVQV